MAVNSVSSVTPRVFPRRYRKGRDVRPRQHYECDLVVFGADKPEICALIDGRHRNLRGDRADVAGAGRLELQGLHGRVVVDELQIQSLLLHVAELNGGEHVPVVGRAHHGGAPGDILFSLGLGKARGEKSQSHDARGHKSLHCILHEGNSESTVANSGRQGHRPLLTVRYVQRRKFVCAEGARVAATSAETPRCKASTYPADYRGASDRRKNA